MIVTDCAVGCQETTADAARDMMVTDRFTEGGITGNAGEFDAATRRLPLASRKIHGDATDQAILRSYKSLGSVAELNRCWVTEFNLASNSKNKSIIEILGFTHPNGLSLASYFFQRPVCLS